MPALSTWKNLATAAAVSVGVVASVATSEGVIPAEYDDAATAPFVATTDGVDRQVRVELRSTDALSHTMTFSVQSDQDVPGFTFQLEVIRADKEPELVTGAGGEEVRMELDVEPDCEGDVCEHDETLLLRLTRTDSGTDPASVALHAQLDVAFDGGAAPGDRADISIDDEDPNTVE